MKNWYIGQRIVCIKTHHQGFFKKGQEFTITGLMQGCCHIELDIGITCNHDITQCLTCGSLSKATNATAWFREVYFVPLDEWNEAYKKVAEIIKELETELV